MLLLRDQQNKPTSMIIRSRRFYRYPGRIRRGGGTTAFILASCSSQPPRSLVTPLPPAVNQTALPKTHEPVRGVWLTTVSRLDGRR